MAINTYKKGDDVRLTKNFTVSEFACHGNSCCSTVKIDSKLVTYLQQIRDHFGKSVNISSGYRCAKHNKTVGGVTGSYHSKGMAADIVVKDVAPAEVAKYAESIGIKGIGLYETRKDGYFVHIDTRSVKSFWYGQAQLRRTTFGAFAEADYTQRQFIKDVQKACGATNDGIAGPETLDKTVTLSLRSNTHHAVVKPVQKYLKALGINEVGDVDGVVGLMFVSAVAHFQLDNDCEVDGVITAKNKTWKKLLGMK